MGTQKVVVLLLVCFSYGFSHAILKDPNEIIPVPQHYEILSATEIVVDSSWKIVCDETVAEDIFSAGYLHDKMYEATDSNLNIQIVGVSQIPSQKRIVIGNPHQNGVIDSIADSHGIDLEADLENDTHNQGYVLWIDPNEIIIAADTTAGTFYGVISLLWLLQNEQGNIVLPHTEIIDWPDLLLRGFYGEGGYTWEGDMIYTLTDPNQWIEVLTKYKYNLWTNSIRRIDDNDGDIYNDTDDAIARKQFLEQRHFFTASNLAPLNLREQYPNLYEGVYAEDVHLTLASDSEGDYFAVVSETPEYEFGFEETVTYRTDLPDEQWFFQGGAAGFWEQITASNDVYSGSYAVRMDLEEDLSETGGSTDHLYFLNHPLLPGRTYLLSFWAKVHFTDNDHSDRMPQVWVDLYDEEGENLYYRNVFIENDEWTCYTMAISTKQQERTVSILSRANGCSPLTYCIDDVKLYELDDKLRNVIDTGDSRVTVWNSDRSVQYAEGQDYELLTDGTVDYANPMTASLTRIRWLDVNELPAGQEITVDYDYVVNFQSGRNEYISLSDSCTLTAYENYIEETMSVIRPDYVLINMDEIRGFNRDSRAAALDLDNSHVLGNFLNNIVDIIHSFDPNTQVLIWDDMLSPYHNGRSAAYELPYGGQAGKTWYALDMLSREKVSLICWKYDMSTYTDSIYSYKMPLSGQLYNALGFSYVGGTWDTEENIKWWSYLCYQQQGLGLINHEFGNNIGGVGWTANYAWNSVKNYTAPNNPYGPENPQAIDTDNDGLSDYSELIQYGTDLSEADTDGDGILDSQDGCPLEPIGQADPNTFAPGTCGCDIACQVAYYVTTDGDDEMNNGLSWQSPFATIQKAIDVAVDGSHIYAAAGTYFERINFLGKNISIHGAGANQTILDGGGSSVYSTVSFKSGETACQLSDFTVLGGKYGIYAVYNSHPTVTNCIIADNLYDGIIVFSYSSIEAHNCEIFGNNRHGIYLDTNCQARINQCAIYDNTSNGIYSTKYCTGNYENNLLFSNGGYGLNINLSTGETIRNNLIYRNHDGLSISYCSAQTLTVWNNTITDNTLYGIITKNNSFAPSIQNCVVWGNSDNMKNCTATYSCVQYGDGGGTNNITSNPLFTDPDGTDNIPGTQDDDYHLTTNSPCIDVGKSSSSYTGQTDIDGDNRVIDITGKGDGNNDVDMGADEYNP
jgi:parallel beta-helix repeat protein